MLNPAPQSLTVSSAGRLQMKGSEYKTRNILPHQFPPPPPPPPPPASNTNTHIFQVSSPEHPQFSKPDVEGGRLQGSIALPHHNDVDGPCQIGSIDIIVQILARGDESCARPTHFAQVVGHIERVGNQAINLECLVCDLGHLQTEC